MIFGGDDQFAFFSIILLKNETSSVKLFSTKILYVLLLFTACDSVVLHAKINKNI
jgi:hypothetical protein